MLSGLFGEEIIFENVNLENFCKNLLQKLKQQVYIL